MPFQRAYPDITWILDTDSGIDYNRKDFYTIGDMEVVPLRWSDSLVKLPYNFCMASKFLLFGYDWKDWKQNAMFQRDHKKESELIDFLGIRDSKFTLVNNNFWTIGRGKRTNIDLKDETVVNMDAIEGFSLFDWCGVMELASEIHSVSTSTLYIFELLDLKCPIHLYPRTPNEPDFKNVEYIFSKDYILHL